MQNDISRNMSKTSLKFLSIGFEKNKKYFRCMFHIVFYTIRKEVNNQTISVCGRHTIDLH